MSSLLKQNIKQNNILKRRIDDCLAKSPAFPALETFLSMRIRFAFFVCFVL